MNEPTGTEGVVDALRQHILNGGYDVGEHLREAELARIIGVSRTPVREALQRLAVEGVVDLFPHRGARVAGWSEDQLDEIFSLRVLLESFGANRAATRIGADDLERLAGLQAQMEEAAERPKVPRLDRVAELNNEFHQLLLRAGGGPRLTAILSSLAYVPIVTRTFLRYSGEDLARSFAAHNELIAAFAARDGAWAEAVMRAHLLAARQVLRHPSDRSTEGT